MIENFIKFKFALSIFLLMFSCENKDHYFDKIKHNDVKLHDAVEGEWLYGKSTKEQTFTQYLNSKHLTPDEKHNIIYIQPIGLFDSIQKQKIEYIREYLTLFFQVKTLVLKPISDSLIPISARRTLDDNNEQLLAGYILDSLLKHINAENKIAVMGLTAKDLYPKPDWNFVFGLASYENQVAVSSIYRLQSDDINTGDLCLLRLLKICSHEISHMFGLQHCVNANCVMNGTNSLEETDYHVARLCSNCQKKLNACIKYDNNKRINDLFQYFKNHNFKKEQELVKKDMAISQKP